MSARFKMEPRREVGSAPAGSSRPAGRDKDQSPECPPRWPTAAQHPPSRGGRGHLTGAEQEGGNAQTGAKPQCKAQRRDARQLPGPGPDQGREQLGLARKLHRRRQARQRQPHQKGSRAKPRQIDQRLFKVGPPVIAQQTLSSAGAPIRVNVTDGAAQPDLEWQDHGGDPPAQRGMPPDRRKPKVSQPRSVRPRYP